MPTGKTYHCDECKNFPPYDWPGWDDKKAIKLGKQLCLAGKIMIFIVPKNHPDSHNMAVDSWGYFSVPGCTKFNHV